MQVAVHTAPCIAGWLGQSQVAWAGGATELRSAVGLAAVHAADAKQQHSGHVAFHALQVVQKVLQVAHHGCPQQAQKHTTSSLKHHSCVMLAANTDMPCGNLA
jgi:hypothetical protein